MHNSSEVPTFDPFQFVSDLNSGLVGQDEFNALNEDQVCAVLRVSVSDAIDRLIRAECRRYKTRLDKHAFLQNEVGTE